MRLLTLPETFAVCRIDAGEPLPPWAFGSEGFLSLTRTADELSITCEERLVPPDTKKEGGWRAIRVEGTLDFALTGILARLSGALAAAEVSIFAVSTFDTDYILVREAALSKALGALRSAGFETADPPTNK